MRKTVCFIIIIFLSFTAFSQKENADRSYYGFASLGTGTYVFHVSGGFNYQVNDHLLGTHINIGYSPTLTHRTYSDYSTDYALTYGYEKEILQMPVQFSLGPSLVMGQKLTSPDNSILDDKRVGFRTAGLFMQVRIIMQEKKRGWGMCIQSNVNDKSAYIALLITGMFGKLK